MANALKLAAGMAALLVLATAAGWEEIEWPFYSGAALLMIAWVWSRSSLLSIGLERTLEADRIFAGTAVRETLTLRNRSLLPRTWVRLADYSSLPGYDPTRSVSVGGRGRMSWAGDSVAARRGRYRIGPTVLESGDPFGLFDTRRAIEDAHELLVYPRIVDLPVQPRPRGDISGAERHAPGRQLSSSLVRSVRPYVTGDPWNHVAWRASARHGAMLVKEFDPDPVSDEWVFLDLHPIPDQAEEPATEYAVSLATSYAMAWLGLSREVGLLVNRIMPAVLEPDAGDAQRLRILETLAVVHPLGEVEPAALISRFAMRFSRSTGLLVISTGDGSGFASPLRHLATRGVPLQVIAVGAGRGDAGWQAVEAVGIDVHRLSDAAAPHRSGALVPKSANPPAAAVYITGTTRAQ